MMKALIAANEKSECFFWSSLLQRIVGLCLVCAGSMPSVSCSREPNYLRIVMAKSAQNRVAVKATTYTQFLYARHLLLCGYQHKTLHRRRGPRAVVDSDPEVIRSHDSRFCCDSSGRVAVVMRGPSAFAGTAESKRDDEEVSRVFTANEFFSSTPVDEPADHRATNRVVYIELLLRATLVKVD